jgi:hypothetical protein
MVENSMSEDAGDERVAVIALYGPDDQRATKMVVTIFEDVETKSVVSMEKWINHTGDVREDPQIAEQVRDYLRRHNTEEVGLTDRIIGCPHEEGKDYPVGETCPQCPFWANRNRWTGEKEGPEPE